MAKKSDLISSLNTKVKQKVGLINKLELASVHEEMINEVYTNPIIDTHLIQTHTLINDSVNYGYRIALKKVGNIVFLSGRAFKLTNSLNLPALVITFTNQDFIPLNLFDFVISGIDLSSESVRLTVRDGLIYINNFNVAVEFNGHYITNNN
ncbi:MAG: hypothetical protein LH615_04125 [Ferruginibacter sp.]|nr:hypothetical protein [Ferruginibacter sp.]